MTIDRKVSNIEANFRMEGMYFDNDCRRRVKGILSKTMTVSEALEEVNKKYSVFKNVTK